MLEGGIFSVILGIGFVDSWILAFVLAFGILGAILSVTYLGLSKQLGDAEYEVELDGSIRTIRTSPTMTAVWTYALGSLEIDQTWIQHLLGKLALPQRLFCAAYFSWQRMAQLKTVDINDCSAVIRLLHKEAERVEMSKLVAEVQLSNLATTLRDLSLIDGVMFLTRRSLGLSLTNRLVENMGEWTKKNKVAD